MRSRGSAALTLPERRRTSRSPPSDFLGPPSIEAAFFMSATQRIEHAERAAPWRAQPAQDPAARRRKIEPAGPAPRTTGPRGETVATPPPPSVRSTFAQFHG